MAPSASRLLSLLDFRRKPGAPEAGLRLELSPDPAVLYAIGDVHGCLNLLQDVTAQIEIDAASAPDATVILLGDLVDRGPSSAQVIDFVLEQQRSSRLRWISLQGNHEALMLDFLRHSTPGATWLQYGGLETLLSYGMTLEQASERKPARLAALIGSFIPEEHLAFLRALPVMVATGEYAFVHAGVRPDVPLQDQSDYDLLWYRDDFAVSFEMLARVIVHGHTPVQQPLIAANRIAIDTGAYQTGRLTAVRLSKNDSPRFITAMHERDR